jgi:hypothetical protein
MIMPLRPDPTPEFNEAMASRLIAVAELVRKGEYVRADWQKIHDAPYWRYEVMVELDYKSPILEEL